ncbi:uncharacterized protein M6B38_128170 [Iris pallida]|uniref:Transmembrane protein n=1 Tax=Iris pallida TaxID=29817 RepID=A0AAX6G5F8_IRIPA|nr:uncharacterized protein M6B38_128170 [Iris pallida]
MVQNHMDLNSPKEKDLSIDLETGTNVVTSEEDDKNLFVKVWNGFGSCEESTRFDNRSSDANSVEENGTPLEKKMVGGEKTKKKSCKKPPRPPRPPSMDAEDQKLIREINELAMLKRARVERMKALKRMKNAKTVSSNGNLVPWIITLIFCVVILWHGVFSRASSSLRFHGSPESSLRSGGAFISVQYYNASAAHGSSSTSPNIVEQVSGLDNRGAGGSGAAG